MRICVAYSPAARQVEEITVELLEGATVLEAIEAALTRAGSPFASKVLENAAATPIGIWGKPASLDQRLAEGDRLELYRPLLADPKTARRERFLKQGKRGAGLFAKRRPGGKAGY